MEHTQKDYSHIPGWGVDADPTNEPTHPMKHYTGEDHDRVNWERPPQQLASVEILKSNERPTLSATFGNTTPPSGLSGSLRRYAFQFSENQFRHWLPLLLADRINMVEGIVDDIQGGHFPNIFKEMGLGAQWKYNRKNFVTVVGAGALAAAATFALMTRKNGTKGRKRLAKVF
jgi:hypothetical protein